MVSDFFVCGGFISIVLLYLLGSKKEGLDNLSSPSFLFGCESLLSH